MARKNKPVTIEPASFGMTGAAMGHVANIRSGFEWQSGPLDAPDYLPAGSLKLGRYFRGSKGKPGHFYVLATTTCPRHL